MRWFNSVINVFLFGTILLSFQSNSIAGAGRTVLVVSQVDDQGDLLTPVVEVYDFLSRTWRIFEPPLSSGKDSNLPKSNNNDRKKHAARLINEDSLLEFDLAVPSIKKESLPPNLEGGAPFYYGDTLCLAGGYNTNASILLKNVDCWNPLQDSTSANWVGLPPMSYGRYKAAAVVLDGKLYVAGGYNTNTHQFMDSVEVFDDVSQQWYSVSPLLKGGRAGHKIEAVGGKLYVMGGWRKFKFLDEVEEYDPLLDKWTIKAKMPGPLAYFGSVVKNGQVYVVGGISGFRNTDETGQLRVYSPSRDAWANIQPPMSVLKGKVSAVLASDL